MSAMGVPPDEVPYFQFMLRSVAGFIGLSAICLVAYAVLTIKEFVTKRGKTSPEEGNE